AAVVVRRLAHEVQALRGARAGGVEEIAIARNLVGSRQPRASVVEPAARVIVEERRAAAAAGQASLLEPEDEDGVEAPRASAQEVDHRDATRIVARPGREHGTLDRPED